MQVDEVLAQDSRCQASEIRTPLITAAAGLALETRTQGRLGPSLCAS